MTSPVNYTTTTGTITTSTTATCSTTTSTTSTQTRVRSNRVRDICQNGRKRAEEIKQRADERAQTTAQISANVMSTTATSFTTPATTTTFRVTSMPTTTSTSSGAEGAEQAALAAATPPQPGIRFVPQNHRPMTEREETNELMGLLEKLKGRITYREEEALTSIIKQRLVTEGRNLETTSRSPIMASPIERMVLAPDNLHQREVWVRYLLALVSSNPEQFMKIYDDLIETAGNLVQLADGTKRALNEHEIIFVLVVFEQMKNKRYGFHIKDFALEIAQREDKGEDTLSNLMYYLNQDDLKFWVKYNIEMEQNEPIGSQWQSRNEMAQPNYSLIRVAAQRRFEALRGLTATRNLDALAIARMKGISEDTFTSEFNSQKHYIKNRDY